PPEPRGRKGLGAGRSLLERGWRRLGRAWGEGRRVRQGSPPGGRRLRGRLQRVKSATDFKPNRGQHSGEQDRVLTRQLVGTDSHETHDLVGRYVESTGFQGSSVGCCRGCDGEV